MGKFFKNFGLGIVYVILLPIIIAITLLVGAYGLLVAFFQSLFGIVRFFKGEPFFPSLHEDREVAMIAKAQHDIMLNGVPPQPKEEPTPAPAQNTTYVQNNYYQNNPNDHKAAPNPALGQQPSFQNPSLSQPITAETPSISQNTATFEAIPAPKDADPEPVMVNSLPSKDNRRDEQ